MFNKLPRSFKVGVKHLNIYLFSKMSPLCFNNTCNICMHINSGISFINLKKYIPMLKFLHNVS